MAAITDLAFETNDEPARISPPAATLPRPVTPRTPTLDLQGSNSRPVIDYQTSPLRAISALLLDFGRGLQGQQLYTEELKQRRAQEDALEYKKLETGSSALTKGLELMQNTPPSQREQVMRQYATIWEPLFPGIGNVLIEASQQPQATQEQLNALGEHGQTLIALTGSVDGALKLAAKPDFMKALNEQADARNAPEVIQAFKRAGQMLQNDPRGNQALAAAAQNGWTLSDLQDPAVQQALGLTQSHVNSIARSPEIQSQLRGFGFIPTADIEGKAKAAVEEKPLDRIAAEAAARRSAEENAKIVAFVNPTTGEVRREPQGQRAALAAQGFQPVITGRTEQDLTAEEKAAARIVGKQAGEDVTRADRFLTSSLGLPADTTVGDLAQKGVQPKLEKSEKELLQTTEIGFKNARSILSQARQIIEENPNANTLTASVSKLANNLRQEVSAIAEATGSDLAVDTKKEVEKYDDVFRANGISSAVLKSLVIDLAYVQAASRGQHGTGLGKKDVELFSQIIGASNSDPRQLLPVFDSIEERFDDAYRNQFESIVRARPPSQIQDVRTAEQYADQLSKGEVVRAEELQALSPRAKRVLKERLKANAAQ